MSVTSALGNAYFVYQFIKKLVIPFSNTEAFKLGIIDEKGKILKKKVFSKNQRRKRSLYIIGHVDF